MYFHQQEDFLMQSASLPHRLGIVFAIDFCIDKIVHFLFRLHDSSMIPSSTGKEGRFT